MVIKCICIDDEALSRKGLELALSAHQDAQLVASYSTAEEALNKASNDIDVLFVDIEMPRINGFELIEKWPGKLPITVFVTAYNQYAIQAFEAQALDYVLKPIEEERFAQVMQRIRSQLSTTNAADKNQHLNQVVKGLKRQLASQMATTTVKTDDGYFRLSISDILYVEAAGDHVCIHTKSNQYIVRDRLKNMLVRFGEYDFIQIHRSFLVNGRHVKGVLKTRFGNYQVTLTGQKALMSSRRFRSEVLKLVKSLDL